jgi:hypothetical protein
MYRMEHITHLRLVISTDGSHFLDLLTCATTALVVREAWQSARQSQIRNNQDRKLFLAL